MGGPAWVSEFGKSMLTVPATVTAAVAIAYLLGQFEPDLSGVAAFIQSPVPLWAIFAPIVVMFLVTLGRGQGSITDRDNASTYREAIRFRTNEFRSIQSKMNERISSLEKENLDKHKELKLTRKNLDSMQRRFEQIESFCKMSQSLFDVSLDLFYPQVLEASDRMEYCYAHAFREKRRTLADEYRKAYFDGRNCWPYPARMRERFVFFAGMTGQLTLDLVLMAEIAARLPLDLLEEAAKHPDWDHNRLFNEWFERAKSVYGASVVERCESYPPDAGGVIDYFMDQAAREVGDEWDGGPDPWPPARPRTSGARGTKTEGGTRSPQQSVAVGGGEPAPLSRTEGPPDEAAGAVQAEASTEVLNLHQRVERQDVPSDAPGEARDA